MPLPDQRIAETVSITDPAGKTVASSIDESGDAPVAVANGDALVVVVVGPGSELLLGGVLGLPSVLAVRCRSCPALRRTTRVRASRGRSLS